MLIDCGIKRKKVPQTPGSEVYPYNKDHLTMISGVLELGAAADKGCQKTRCLLTVTCVYITFIHAHTYTYIHYNYHKMWA